MARKQPISLELEVTAKQRVEELAQLLDSDVELTKRERRNAAAYLRTLGASASALKLIGPPAAGRRPTAMFIAAAYKLAYLLDGKSAAAATRLVDIFGCTPGHVLDCYSDHAEFAERYYQLKGEPTSPERLESQLRELVAPYHRRSRRTRGKL